MTYIFIYTIFLAIFIIFFVGYLYLYRELIKHSEYII